MSTTTTKLETMPQGHRVLLALGDSASATHLRTLLNKIGYQIIVAQDGLDARALLSQESPPELALLDLQMADLNPTDLCRNLRARRQRSFTYVIVLTRWNEQAERIAVLEAGADDCIPSPVDIRELRLRLQKGSQVVLENALRTSEERFRSAFESAGIGMAMVNGAGELVQVNRALCHLLGFSSEQFLALKLSDLVYAEGSESGADVMRALLSAGRTNEERRFVTNTGDTVWASCTIAAVADAGENTDSFVLQLQDISARKTAEAALQQSLDASRRALREVADQKYALDQHAIVSVSGADGRITYANEKFCLINQYSREELIGQDHRLLNSGLHSNQYFQEMYRVITGGGTWRGEVRNRRKDGSFYWADTTIVPFLDEAGKPWQYAAIRTDITQRKADEEALLRKESFLRALTDNVNDLIFVLDDELRYSYASSSHHINLGYEPKELLGSDPLPMLHPEDQETFKRAVAELVHDGTPRTVTVRTRHKNGGWRHMESHYSLLRNPDGDVEGVLVVARPIDDRILAEQKLQAAYSETELFFQSIPSILIGLDGEAKITRWNQTASRNLGVSTQSAVGRAIYDCGIQWVHPDIQGEVARWLQTEDSLRCDNLSFLRDSKPRFLGLNVRRLPAPPGTAKAAFIITGADITERKALEDQLRQAQKLEAIGQLSAGVAHEINTHTQFVSDNVRFLKDAWGDLANLICFSKELRSAAGQGPVGKQLLDKFDELSKKADVDYLLKEIPSAIDQSQEGLQRVANIVKAIKEFSHPGSSEKKGIDLNKAIETTITVARNEWKYVADLEARLDPDLSQVPCLSSELNQVVLNLIVNAAHAIAERLGENSGQKGKISVTTRRNPPWAEIDIQDSGQGIPPEIRSRIFEPFFTTKDVGKGTGQGLALAHSVVVGLHKGQIWFDSELGVGTTFHLRIPLEAAEVAAAGK
jgi:PAS domain S-box-containing protein